MTQPSLTESGGEVGVKGLDSGVGLLHSVVRQTGGWAGVQRLFTSTEKRKRRALNLETTNEVESGEGSRHSPRPQTRTRLASQLLLLRQIGCRRFHTPPPQKQNRGTTCSKTEIPGRVARRDAKPSPTRESNDRSGCGVSKQKSCGKF